MEDINIYVYVSEYLCKITHLIIPLKKFSIILQHMNPLFTKGNKIHSIVIDELLVGYVRFIF